jgi:hypothetical protein
MGWVTYCQNVQSMTYHDLGANSERIVIGQSIPMVAKCPIPKMDRWHLSLNKQRNMLNTACSGSNLGLTTADKLVHDEPISINVRLTCIDLCVTMFQNLQGCD